MKLLKILFLLLLTSISSFSYDKADTRFEVESLSDGRLKIRAFEKKNLIFGQIVDKTLKAPLKNKFCHLEKFEDIFALSYRGKDQSALTLIIDETADVSLLVADKTNYKEKKTWGFKTNGNLINRSSASFYKAFIDAQEFHNFGIFKAFSGRFHQKYLFNQGIFHFGDEGEMPESDTYEDYLLLINKAAKPSFEQGIIDDHGVFIAENGLKISGLTYRSNGLVDIEKQLILDNVDIENNGRYSVDGIITGTVNHIKNRGAFYADSINRNLLINNFSNEGAFSLKKDSDIFSSNIFNNKAFIFGNSNISVGTHKKPEAFGTISCEGEITSIIEEIMGKADSVQAYKGAKFFSKIRKIKILVELTEDHFLNVITDHYTVDWKGIEKFVNRTETGDILEYTVKTQKLLEREIGVEEIPQEVKKVRDFIKVKKDEIQNLKNKLKEKLKNSKLTSANRNSLLQAFIKELRKVGFDNEDISAIVDDEEVNGLIEMLSSYEYISDSARDKLFQENTLTHSVLDKLGVTISRYSWHALQTIRQNPVQLMMHLCDVINAATVVTKHPYVLAASGVCNLGKMSVNAQKGFDKLNVFFSKKSEGGKGQASNVENPRISNPPKAESPVWKEFKNYKQEIKTNNNIGSKKEYYEWDNTHNDIEVFNHNGDHLGSMNPISGEMYKPAVYGRNIRNKL